MKCKKTAFYCLASRGQPVGCKKTKKWLAVNQGRRALNSHWSKQATVFLLALENHPISFIESDWSSILSKTGREVVGGAKAQSLTVFNLPVGRVLGCTHYNHHSPLPGTAHTHPAGTGAGTPGGRSSVPPTASSPASTGSSWWGS